MLTLTHENRHFTNWAENDLLAQGVPQNVIEAAKAAQREVAIRAECRRRIYAVASAETQMNMATAASVVSAIETDARSQEDVALLDGVRAALGWVSAMRAAVTDLAAQPEADFTADSVWPDLPPEVAALVAQF